MYAARDKKRQRKTQLSLEHLDMRIAPAAMGAAVALAAELKVEARHVHRWEAALGTAQPGSSHQQMLSNRIAHTEARMNSQETRLARIEARTLSSAQPGYVIKGQRPPSQPPSTTIAQPGFVIKGQRPPSEPPSTTIAQPGYVIRGQRPPAQPPSTTIAQPGATVVVPGPAGGSISTTDTTAGQSTSATGTGTGTGTGSSGDTGSQTLPTNVSVTLDVIYNAYEQDPSSFPANLPSTDGANKVVIQGSNVGIQVQDSNPADFAAMLSSLQSDGMQIQTSSATYGIVVGLLPIAALPAVAQLTDAPSVTPLLQPLL